MTRDNDIRTGDVDNIIFADLNSGDGNLDAALMAMEAFVRGNTRSSSPGEYEQVANNIGNTVAKALLLANAPQGEVFLDYALRTMHEVTNQPGGGSILQTGDVDDIIYTDLNNGDGNVDAALMAMEAFVRGDTRSSSPGEYEQVANNIGNTVAKALRLANAPDGEVFLDYALRTMYEVTNRPDVNNVLETKDIDNIIYADLNNGDGNVDAALMAMETFLRGDTRSSSPGEYEQVANNIGNTIVRALRMSNSPDGEVFLDYALRTIYEVTSRPGVNNVLETKDVDNIIYADLYNGDGNVDAALMAMEAFVRGDTRSSSPGEYEQVADNLGHTVTRALYMSNSPDGEAFLDYALRTMHEVTNKPGVNNILETDDVDNIIYADLNNGDGNVDAALMAMEAFVRGDTRSSSPGEYEQVADNLGNTIARALRMSNSPDGEAFLDYALRTMHEVTLQPGVNNVLETDDIDNIINADLHNGDGNVDAALMAMEAFVRGDTRSSSPMEFEQVADNMGNTVVRALVGVNSPDGEAFLDYALRTMHEVTRQPGGGDILETTDIDDIILADLTNGDDDLSAAQMALDAFVSGSTRSDSPGDFQQTAENIVNHVADAGNQPHVENFAASVDFLLSNYTDTTSLV